MNLFDIPFEPAGEIFSPLLTRSGIRVERIVSTGQTTPIDAPYVQDHDEWVVLLAGKARLLIDGQDEIALTPGDQLMIPAGRSHRVTYTSADPATIWLAIHFEIP